MSLTSYHFFIFFLGLYFLLYILSLLFRKSGVFSKICSYTLIIFSYCFILWADWRSCICVILLTIFTYCIGCRIKAAYLKKAKKHWLELGVFVSLLQLAVFKYLNFFIKSFASVFMAKIDVVQIIVPLGVSFYTFSVISYMVDIYRDKIEPFQSWLDYTLYVSFFPKLTSGPIVRPDVFLSQLHETEWINHDRLKKGIQIVFVGIFKKMVIADHLALFVNDVYNAPIAFSSLTVFWATISYTLQIYFDFSGYSDIAIGLSTMLGFDFERNFNLPYISKNPTEFWKRWHISLSSWLQEYLYYPLGGNRKGTLRTYVNLFLTMVIGGLWHGADWTFIVWGGVNGFGLVVHKLFVKWKKSRNYVFFFSKTWNLISVILDFLFANFCWIFFRAESLTKAVAIIRQIMCCSSGIRQPFTWTILALVLLVVEIAVPMIESNGTRIDQKYLSLDLDNLGHIVIFFTLIGITVIMAYVGDTAFIYGNF